MARTARIERDTKETRIRLTLDLEGGEISVNTGIGLFDHMLELFAAHGFFGLTVTAEGDTHVDDHHTVEDVGLVLGDAFAKALGDKKGIVRYGHAVTPMDEALAWVAVDLSGRPYWVFKMPDGAGDGAAFGLPLAKEFFRAFCTRGGMNLHVHVPYGENEHHMMEAAFKAAGRALDQAVASDGRVKGVRSTKGVI